MAKVGTEPEHAWSAPITAEGAAVVAPADTRADGPPDAEEPRREPEPQPADAAAGGEPAPLDPHSVLFTVPCDVCGSLVAITPETGAFELPRPSRYIACSECAGFGEVATGSLVREHAKRPCPACEGFGYLDRSSGEVRPPLAEERRPLPSSPPPPPLGASAGEEPPWPGAQRDTSVPGGWR